MPRFDKYRKTYFKTKKRRISLQFFSREMENGTDSSQQDPGTGIRET